MNRTLDVEIRRAMAELAQAAPLPRPVEVVEAAGTSSVRAMSAPARRRTWAVAAASFAAGALVVGIVVVVERGDHRPRTQSVSPATIDSTVPMAIFSYPFVAAVVVNTSVWHIKAPWLAKESLRATLNQRGTTTKAARVAAR